MKRLIFFLLAIVFHFSAQSQSPAGKWKLTTCFTEDENGKKTDLLKDYIKETPCLATVVLEFTANGKISVPAEKCPAALQNQGLGTKWEVRKNKITIYTDDEDIDPVTYDIEYGGNKMRWKMHFPDTKGVRLLLFEYTRV